MCWNCFSPHNSPRSTTISFYRRHSSRDFFPLSNSRLLVTSCGIKKKFFSHHKLTQNYRLPTIRKMSFSTMFPSIISSQFYLHRRNIASKMSSTTAERRKIMENINWKWNSYSNLGSFANSQNDSNLLRKRTFYHSLEEFPSPSFFASTKTL
jgi:hypothetical protein